MVRRLQRVSKAVIEFGRLMHALNAQFRYCIPTYAYIVFSEHPVQRYYPVYAWTTFITSVKSLRNFSCEIERSSLTHNIHSQSLRLRHLTHRTAIIEKINHRARIST